MNLIITIVCNVKCGIKLKLFILQVGLNFLVQCITQAYHDIVTVIFQGHPRSKVMEPNERLYACSYV